MRSRNNNITLIVIIITISAILLLLYSRPSLQQACQPCERFNEIQIEPCEKCSDEKEKNTSVLVIQQQEVKFPFKKIISSEISTILKERRNWKADQWEKEAIRLMNENKNKNFVIVATANSGHKEFTFNWIASLNRNKYFKFLIYCLDFQLYQELVEYGYVNNAVIAPRTWTNVDIEPVEHKWMESAYNLLTQAKLRIQTKLLSLDYWILFSDVDLVFLNPNVVSHILFLVGEYCSPSAPTQCFTDFVYMYDQDTDINTGFFAARPTDVIKEAFERTCNGVRRWGIDQLAFNYEIRTEMKVKYSKSFKGLDKLLYANGHVYFQEHRNAKYKIDPLVVHANYVQGSLKKKELLQSGNMWYL